MSNEIDAGQVAESEETQLYRHFAADGELLYIGISLSTIARLAQHAEHSHWFKRISRVEIQAYPNRRAAMEAEKDAISREQPTFNIKRPPGAASDKAIAAEVRSLLRWHVRESLQNLERSIVAYRPLYSVEDVAKELGLMQSIVRKLIAAGQLGHIELPTAYPGKARQYVTGWQLLEFLDKAQHVASDKEADDA